MRETARHDIARDEVGLQSVCNASSRLRAEMWQDPIRKLKPHILVLMVGRSLEEGQRRSRGRRGSKNPLQLWTARPRSLELEEGIGIMGRGQTFASCQPVNDF